MKTRYILQINTLLDTMSTTMLKAILGTLRKLPKKSNKCLHFDNTSSIIKTSTKEVDYCMDALEELIELLKHVDVKYYSYLRKLLREFEKED